MQSGSGCGSVGRAVASNTKGSRFESSHRQKLIYLLNICLLSTVYWKDESKVKKRPGMAHFKKNSYTCRVVVVVQCSYELLYPYYNCEDGFYVSNLYFNWFDFQLTMLIYVQRIWQADLKHFQLNINNCSCKCNCLSWWLALIMGN